MKIYYFLLFFVLLLHIVFLFFYWIGFYPYLIGFLLGTFSTAVWLPVIAHYVYYLQLLDDKISPGSGSLDPKFAEAIVKPANDIWTSVQDTKETLESQIIKDKAKETVVYGYLTIQYAGKKKSRQLGLCVLKGESLFFQAKKGNAWERDIKCIHLKGAYVRIVDKKEEKKEKKEPEKKEKTHEEAENTMKYALEIIHKSRCIFHKIDYMFLRCKSLKDRQYWYYALKTVCHDYNEIYRDLTAGNKGVDEYRKVLHLFDIQDQYFRKEQAPFLNLFIARFFIHIRESKSFKKKLLEYLSLKLSEKLMEKNLESKLADIVITDIDLGSKSPKISNIFVRKPDVIEGPNFDLSVDFNFSYDEGDAMFGLRCRLNVSRMSVPLEVTMRLNQFKGVMRLLLPPYPMARMGLSFYKHPEPIMDLVVNIKVGGNKGITFFPDKVKSILKDKLKQVFVEKLVEPNRKYIRMPGVPKKEPIPPKTSNVVSADKNTLFGIKSDIVSDAFDHASTTTPDHNLEEVETSEEHLDDEKEQEIEESMVTLLQDSVYNTNISLQKQGPIVQKDKKSAMSKLKERMPKLSKAESHIEPVNTNLLSIALEEPLNLASQLSVSAPNNGIRSDNIILPISINDTPPSEKRDENGRLKKTLLSKILKKDEEHGHNHSQNGENSLLSSSDSMDDRNDGFKEKFKRKVEGALRRKEEDKKK